MGFFTNLTSFITPPATTTNAIATASVEGADAETPLLSSDQKAKLEKRINDADNAMVYYPIVAGFVGAAATAIKLGVSANSSASTYIDIGVTILAASIPFVAGICKQVRNSAMAELQKIPALRV